MPRASHSDPNGDLSLASMHATMLMIRINPDWSSNRNQVTYPKRNSKEAVDLDLDPDAALVASGQAMGPQGGYS